MDMGSKYNRVSPVRGAEEVDKDGGDDNRGDRVVNALAPIEPKIRKPRKEKEHFIAATVYDLE